VSDKIDILLEEDEDELFDIDIDDDGDFVADYGFNTPIRMSVLTEARADEGEVNKSYQRRGWIGNETPDISNFELGSKLWLEYQSRKTVATRNAAVDHTRESVDWFVPAFLDAVDVTGNISTTGIDIEIVPTKKSGETDKLLISLWGNTGQ
jgi:phage gp46-like protein